MAENESPSDDTPVWRAWLPHLIIPVGFVPGVAIILTFGPAAFAGYLLGLLALTAVSETLLERRWPMRGDDGLDAELDCDESVRET